MLFKACLLHCIIVSICDNTSPIMERIVGGTTTTVTKIPYQIALYINNNFTCGGSVITKNCVLTAGHCVIGRPSSSLKVRAGITLLNSIGGEMRTVSHTYIPDTFNVKSLAMDMAILKLNTPLGGTNIAPIELSNKQLNAGDQVQVSGWGLTTENASTVSNQLRVVTVQTISKAECKKEYPTELTDAMFCAGARGGGKDSCAGDSGGPAVKDGRQVGIVSWGKGCGRVNLAGVYTSIRDILPWVNRIKLMHCGIK